MKKITDLKLYNTASQRKETFRPTRPDHVEMYVCGPTVYDRAHLGNARSVVVFDLLYRFLKHTYANVTYVRNITDIDDKIIAAARANGETIQQLTQKTLQYFHEDMGALGAIHPTHEPKATEFIPQMIETISTLIKKDYAYEVEGHVMFHVKHYTSYGALSGRKLEDLQDGARIEVMSCKRDPSDFVLWKPSDKDALTPGWESPWGYGRPGWHIECSAMSQAYLELPLDIHGGGQDLIFPHHENERAQSCCAFGVDKLAHFWVHNGILMVNGEKMSKSLGNFVVVEELLRNWPGEVVRWALLSTHYRQPLNWTERTLVQAKENLDRLYGALRAVDLAKPLEITKDSRDGVVSEVMQALSNDLNSPDAFAALHHLAGDVNKETDIARKREKASLLKKSGALMGFLQVCPEAWFQKGTGAVSGPHEKEIIQRLAERTRARSRRDFKAADEIRDALKKQGILIEDSEGETTWRRG